MPNALARLKATLQSRNIDPALVGELEAEYTDLVHKADQLETLLITIVRTGWPWDEEGEPNAIFGSARDGYGEAMVAAKELLGLGLNTRITRTEPKT
jgi:hypothetical protein